MNTIFRETYANDSNITLIALPSMCYNVSFLWPCWTFFAPCWFILPNSNNIQSYFWCQEWKHFSTYMSYDFWKVYTERNCYFGCFSLHWYVPFHSYYNLYFEKVSWYTKLQKYSNTEWIQIRVMSSHAQSILCVPILVFWFITLARTGKKYNVNMSCINAFIFITFQSNRTACPQHCFLL